MPAHPIAPDISGGLTPHSYRRQGCGRAGHRKGARQPGDREADDTPGMIISDM